MSRTLTIVAIMWSVGGSAGIDDIPGRPPKNPGAQSSLTPNGIRLNGIRLNGIRLNGIRLNGIRLNGIRLNGMALDGLTLDGVEPAGVRADGTSLRISRTGAPLAGRHLVGSTWTSHTPEGAVVHLRIDAAAQGTGGNRDLWSYRMSVSADGSWQPACLDADGRPLDAVSVRGTWNYAQGVPDGGSYDPDSAQFTVACRGSAIAKCVEHGYKPWAGATAELAACVRALRADYCGDGTPYTKDGTMVNIFDDRGIQVDGAAWVPEAEWTPQGAACISGPGQTRFHQVSHTSPPCMHRMLARERSCGTGFEHGALIITELAPR